MGMMVTALMILSLTSGVVQTQDAPQGIDTQQQQGQRGRGQGALPNPPGGVAVQELQAMFDAYALVQAQRVLRLSDEQYQRFFVQMNRLQDLRRQHTRQRMRLVGELRRMAGAQGNTDDATIGASLQELTALDEKFVLSLRAARTAIDEVLTVRQRAAFRFFEEDMERQKIDFMTRARQPGRG